MSTNITDKKTFYKYKKVLRHEKHNLKDWSQKLNKIYSEEGDSELLNAQSKTKRKGPTRVKQTPFFKQVKSFETKKAEISERKREQENKRKEREEAMEKYNKEKKRKRKMMLKVNHKGQPSMSSRMNLLLEKIQKTTQS